MPHHHKEHPMGHSHKNTSSGGHEMGNKGADYLPIRDNHDPKPPPGASNSYEKIRKNIDRKDDRSLAHRPYTREKMMNK